MADVFISYKSDRRPAIEHLAEILTDHGYSVWFDYGLLTGSDFSKQIEVELRVAKVVVVVWCARAISSDWVRSEARFAKRVGKFCPVKLDHCDLPIEFDGDQTIELGQWTAEPRPFEPGALLREVSRAVGRAAKPDIKALERAQRLWARYGGLSLSGFPVVAPVSAREGLAPDFGVTSARKASDAKRDERRSKRSITISGIALSAAVAVAAAATAITLLSLQPSPSEHMSLEAFVAHGKQAVETDDSRMLNDRVEVRQYEASIQAARAQADLPEAVKASQASPNSLVPNAIDHAKRHFLGLPLNQSTAMVVTAALNAPSLAPAQKALLQAALRDWSMPVSMLIDTMGPEQMPSFEAVETNAQVLLADASPEMKFFGHMARGAYYFRVASNGGLNEVPKPYMDWESGCKELVDEATAALNLMPSFMPERGADAEASGLNLHYWRGQCWRRKGEPHLALEEFQALMRVAETDAIPPSNPLKYQSYHGMGTVMTTLLDMDQKSNEQRRDEATLAGTYLSRAGQYRRAAGATQFGEASSSGNIGLLLLKSRTPEGLVATLHHTQSVDLVALSSWNLVAQLAAIRALQRLDHETRATALGDRHSDDYLRTLAFETLAELAYLDPSSIPRTELKQILAPEHHAALDEAIACVGRRGSCYELTIK